MPTTRLNDIDLFHTTTGTGPPVVLVPGGWSDQSNWGLAIPELANRFRVVAYDRRGHGRSARPASPVVTRREHEDDLAAVIEALGPAPTAVVGNSYGAIIALGLAARRPDLVGCVAAHEPALVSIAEDGEDAALMAGVRSEFDGVIADLSAGDVEGGTRRFFERVAMGPGAWELIPEPVRRVFLSNAPAFAADFAAPDWDGADLAAVHRSGVPVLLTKGDGSPRWLQVVADRVGQELHGARAEVIPGAGHSPHITLPRPYAARVAAFCDVAGAARAA